MVEGRVILTLSEQREPKGKDPPFKRVKTGDSSPPAFIFKIGWRAGVVSLPQNDNATSATASASARHQSSHLDTSTVVLYDCLKGTLPSEGSVPSSMYERNSTNKRSGV